MKTKPLYILLIIGLGALIIMFKTRATETLVTESAPISNLGYDEKMAKTPYETATFGMG